MIADGNHKMLEQWDQRTRQSRCLFNPAFLAALICVSVRAYDKESIKSSGLPLVLSYLVLPLTLHADTRETFPSSTITSLTRWIGQHPEIHVGLADRATGFRELTCEAIRFAVAGGIIRITDAGGLVHVPKKPTGLNAAKVASEEVLQCFKAANDLGRWLARVPDPVFLFRALRIHP